MKFAWSIIKEGAWTEYKRAKYFTKASDIIQFYKRCTIWVEIRAVYPEVLQKSIWSLGNGSSINVWRDNWTGDGEIKDFLSSNHINWKRQHNMVYELLENGEWSHPHILKPKVPETIGV
ncbi:hypothetical protein GIB67_026928 [Kingdonia uniflora]|uniref:Uncharacterized protein n=1 Tax=Kingdonia uniflora TaxID=39325 RepID=A0A7J7P1P1_9MAGN|nr:hypothetical protein GIB67_026928 [Kingdonia uniflora]